MRTQKTSGETNKIQEIVGDPKLNYFSSLKIQNPSIKIQLHEHKSSLWIKSFCSLPESYNYRTFLKVEPQRNVSIITLTHILKGLNCFIKFTPKST